MVAYMSTCSTDFREKNFVLQSFLARCQSGGKVQCSGQIMI